MQGSDPKGRLQIQTPEFVNKFRSATGVLNVIVLILDFWESVLYFLGLVNIGIVGYNFSYFKGTWRNNLFHSELTYVVIFCSCFIGTSVNMIGNIMSPQPYATNTVHELVSSATYGFLAALASTVLLIQLTMYGRYFVNSFEVKIFSSILGMVEALFYFINAFVLYRNAQALM